MDQMLDEKKKWGVKNGVIDESIGPANKWLYLDALFRPSQEKFRGPRATLIEIVKHSAPVPVILFSFIFYFRFL